MKKKRGMPESLRTAFFSIGYREKTVIIVEDVFCEEHGALRAAEMINDDGVAEVHIDGILAIIIFAIRRRTGTVPSWNEVFLSSCPIEILPRLPLPCAVVSAAFFVSTGDEPVPSAAPLHLSDF